MVRFGSKSCGWFWGLGLLWLLGCGGSHTPYTPREAIDIHETYRGNYPIKAVCTTGMVADLVRHVGGAHVEVIQLMGPDVDPHLYNANAGDVVQLDKADVIFYNGLHLEGKLSEVLAALARRRPTFAVAEYYPAEKVLASEELGMDPHVWFDVRLWNEARGVVQDVLMKFDPQHARDYETNSAAYQTKLAALDEYARVQLASIPKQQRVLITAHDAFRYFGKAYHVEVKGVQGISTESEASVRHINELVDYIVSNKIKAIFVETSVNERNMKSLLEGCQARGHDIKIGGTLYSDAMGPPGSDVGTYIGMVRHNVDTIVEALK